MAQIEVPSIEPKDEPIFDGLLSLEEVENEETGVYKEDPSLQLVLENVEINLECVKEDLSSIERNTHIETDSISLNNQQYQSLVEKNYSTNFKKEHIEDISSLFTEDNLYFETKKFYQQVFNDILEKTSEKKLDDLQKQYLEHLLKISHVEAFKCLSCDYQTLNKSNLKSHLWIIHKNELEFEIFHCLSCSYKSKSLAFLNKHLLNHIEESPADNNLSDFDRCNSPEVEKNHGKVKRKTLVEKICDLCDYKTKNKKQFEDHKKTHFSITDSGKNFMCYLCNYKNRSITGIQNHLVKEHSIKTAKIESKTKKCPFCDYTTLSKEPLRVHMLSHKNPDEIDWFKCNQCEFKTKFKANLNLHQQLHNPDKIERKFLCEVCSRAFRNRGKLKLHSLTHKTLDEVSEIFQCNQCSYKTKNKYCLKQHMEVHNKLERFICDICGFQSKRKWNHEKHVLTHRDETEVELHKCDVCAYKTKFKDRLTKHIKKGHHTISHFKSPSKYEWKPTNFSCSECDFKSTCKRSYLDHIKTHENPKEVEKKRLACEFCEFRTKNKGALAQHSLSHKRVDQVKAFKCSQPGCEFQTKFKGSLSAHLERHKDPSEATLYKCDICGLQNRSKWNHNMHLITHKSTNEVEVFTCNICSYQTKFKSYLKAHLKKRHGIVTTRVRVKIESSEN